MELDLSLDDMLQITWEKCPGCRWQHHPNNLCPQIPSPEEEAEDDNWSSQD